MDRLELKKILTPDAHVVVVGLGKSGLSAVKFLLKLGARVSVSEGGRQAVLEGVAIRWLQENGVYLETGGHTSELFTSADLILVSPGVPLTISALDAARKKSVPIVGELALAAEYLDMPVIAVTGTNGKSTVTSLIGHILEEADYKVFVGGNIGVPLTDCLLEKNDAEVAVLEVSSFQLDTAGYFAPQVAVLLNVSPDHLDRYNGYDEYVASKFNIFANQNEEQFAVLNRDDATIAEKVDGFVVPAKKTWFSGQVSGGCDAHSRGNEIVTVDPTGKAVDTEIYPIGGTLFTESPNRENAMAAILAARALGCPRENIAEALKTFLPLGHRVNLVSEIGGVQFVNDSKATNVGAVVSALNGQSKPVVLIAGGRDKGGDFSELIEPVKHRVRAAVLIGEAHDKIAEVLKGVTSIEFAKDMYDAVVQANRLAKPGDVVLLSPACASFDMFDSYGHRGEVFVKAVKCLGKKGKADNGQRIVQEASFA